MGKAFYTPKATLKTTPSFSKFLKPKKKKIFSLKMILGIVVFGIVLLGGVAGLVLGQMNQDNRQQAYEPVPTCAETGGSCRSGSSCGADTATGGKCLTGSICCKPAPTCQENGNTCQFYNCAAGYGSATGTCGIANQKCCKQVSVPTCAGNGNTCKQGSCGAGFKSAPGSCTAGSDEVCCRKDYPNPTCKINGNICTFNTCPAGSVKTTAYTCGLDSINCCKPAPAPAPTCQNNGFTCKTGASCPSGFKSAVGTCLASESVCCKAIPSCPMGSDVQSETTCRCANGVIIARNGITRCPEKIKVCSSYLKKENCNAATDAVGECGWSGKTSSCTSDKVKLCGELPATLCPAGISGIQCQYTSGNSGAKCIPK